MFMQFCECVRQWAKFVSCLSELSGLPVSPFCQNYSNCLLSMGGKSLYKVELFVKGAVFTHRGPCFLSDLGSGEFSDGTGFLCFLLACR